MCGIFGMVAEAGASRETLEAFGRLLRHRGPDGSGYLVEGAIGIGMNRLAIIDREGGAQPMHSSDGLLALVFNGEIYNYRELRRDLQGRIAFQTRSDTEVILNGYQVWGDDVFRRLNGMFAIALYDRRQRVLKLARDPVGVKPLYFLSLPGKFHFASEIKALTGTRLASTVNPRAVAQYLAAAYVFHPETAVSGVQQLKPGHLLEVRDSGERRESTFAEMPFDPGEAAPGPVSGAVRDRLRDAVVRQTVADVPYGLLLSSGLDSMGILAGLHDAGLTENLETFTATYDGSGFAESGPVEQLSRSWGFRNTTVRVTAEKVDEHLDGIFASFDNLEFLPTAAALYALTQVAGSTRRVLLAGNGGDELFAGYPTYRANQLMNRLRFAAPLMNLVAPAMRMIPAAEDYLPMGERIYRFCSGASTDPRLAHVQWRRVWTASAARRLSGLGEPGGAAALYAPQLRYFDCAAKRGLDGLDASIFVDLHTWLVDCGLMMWDKAGMSASTEIRVPYVDLELMRFVLALPRAQRGNPVGSKAVLREALSEVLPREIVALPKRGFQAPVGRWLSGSLGERFRDLSLSLPAELFARKEIERTWKHFRDGQRHLALPLWLLGCLEGWRRTLDLSWG